MKLSELVAYKNLLDTLSANSTRDSAGLDLDRIIYAVANNKVQINETADGLLAHKKNITQMFDQFEETFDQLKQQIDQMISNAEKPMFQQSYQAYEDLNQSLKIENLYQNNIQHVLSRRLPLTEEVNQIYLARLSRYNSWHHAGMILHPGMEPFISHMVGCDPLYVVDENYDLLNPSLAQFNELYQNRLRVSIVNEDSDQSWLDRIPDQQLGVCLAYNFFNFKPFEVIKKYLSEIYQKLKPGGTLIMTFNDCDRYKAVMLVESFFCSYTPGRMIRGWAQHVGFEETFCHHDDGPVTWIEFRKPGESTSLRGGQTLAKILPKPVAESK
jgi:hypothetical protein